MGKQQPDDGLKCSDQTDSSGRSLDKEGNDAKQDSQDSTVSHPDTSPPRTDFTRIPL